MDKKNGASVAGFRGKALLAWTLLWLFAFTLIRPAPAVAANGTLNLSPASTSFGYSLPVSVTATGGGTDFVSGGTTVTLTDNLGNVVSAVSGVTVVDADTVSFSIATGLSQGVYNVRVAYPTGEASTTFEVKGAPAITALSQADLGEGYTSAVTVTATGQNTHWAAGQTQVNLLTAGGSVTGKVSSVSVSGPGSLSFSINTGLTQGTYALRVVTGGETATTTFTVTAPPAVTLNTTETSAGYATPVAVTATGQRTHFSSGTTTVSVLQGTSAAGTASGVTVDQNNQTVSFNIATGLAQGSYTISIVTGAETVTSTFTVTAAATASLSVAEVAQEYTAAIAVTVTGQNTHFSSSQTVVTLLDGSNNSVGSITGQTVASATSLSFNIGTGLAAGDYKIRITSGSEKVEPAFKVTPAPTATASPSSAVEGYSSAVTVAVSGLNTHFVNGQSSVQVLKNGAAVGSVSGLNVTLGTALSFALGTGLATGSYTIRITTGVEQVDASFAVSEAPAVSLSKTEVSQGYSAAITITATGQRTNFSGDSTTVTVLNGSGTSVGTVSNTQVSSATQVSFALGTGLTAGTYTVRIVTGNETVQTTFTVLPAPTISLSTALLAEGYSSREITVTGVNTHFDNTSVVTVLKSGQNTSAAGAPTVTGATSLKFTFAAGQTAGTYVVQVTTGVESVTTSFTISSSASMTISPASLVTGYSATTISVTGVGTKFNLTPQVSILDGNGTDQNKATGAGYTSETALTFTVSTGLATGTYTVRISTSDATVTTATMTVADDTAAPTLTATQSPGSTYYRGGQTVTLAFSVTDNAAGFAQTPTVSAAFGSTIPTHNLTFSRSSEVSGTISGTVTVPASLSTGSQDLTVTVSDRAGNAGSAIAAVMVDNTAPQVTITTPSGGQSYKRGDAITVQATIADTGAGFADSMVPAVTVGGIAATGVTYSKSTSTVSGAITAPDNLGGTVDLAVAVTDKAGNVGTGTASITADTVVPSWTSPTLTITAATLTSVNLAWSGASDNVGVTKYKVYINGLSVATTTGTTYSATNLTQGTSYSFKVEAGDAAGNYSSSTGPTGSITTIASGTQTLQGLVTAPPQGTPFKGGAQVAAAVDFTPITGAPALGTPAVTAAFDGQSVSGFSGAVAGSTIEVTGTFTVPTNLTSGTYNLVISVSDENGNAGQATAAVKVDTDAPAWSGGAAVSQSGVTSSQATISWPAATDATSAVAHYLVTLNGAQVATTTGSTLNYSATGLTAATSYTFTVQAMDVAGNVSTGGLLLSLTTSAASAGGTPSTGGGGIVPGDTLAPIFTGGLTASNITETGLTLSWSAATDNVGVAIYTVYRDGAVLAEVAATSYTVTGLQPGTSYTFSIAARDAAGNTAAGPSATAATLAAAATGTGTAPDSGAGSGSTEPTEPAEPRVPPTEPAGSSLKTEVKEDGTAALTKVVTANEADVANLAGDLLVDLKSDSAAGDGQSPVEVSSRTAEVPVSLLQNLEEARKEVVIDAGVATIEIPPAALTGMAAVSDAAQGGAPVSVQITVEAVDLSKASQAPTGTAAIVASSIQKAQSEGLKPSGKVLVLTAAVVTNGETTAVTSFKQKLTVRIPYGDGVDPNLLGVYRLNRETGKWEYRGGKVDTKNKVVIVQLDSFSEYTVMEYRRTFDDVGAHWARADIELMAARHIARGMTETSFGPNGPVTRAQFAALLVRALGLPGYTGVQSSFRDTFFTDWFHGDVNAAAAAGLIRGDQGLFRPNDQITRQEMAVILSRALALRGKQVSLVQSDVNSLLSVFADSGEIAAWARDSAAQLARAQIISGRAWNQYSPSANATRAEAIVVLKRVLQYLGDL